VNGEEKEKPQETHVVVGVISRMREKEKEYLLMGSTKDFGKFTGFLYPPGGHLEPDENEEEALIREIDEELGIKVKPKKKYAETPGDVENQITHWWKCDVDSHELTIDKDEVDNTDWLTRKEILAHDKVWPATKKFFEVHIKN